MSYSLDIRRNAFESPFGLLDGFFGPLLHRDPRWENSPALARFVPKAEVSESKDAYWLSFDLPGLSKDSIKIDLEDDTLKVSGERRRERELTGNNGETESALLSEVAYGSFSRSFQFPVPVDPEGTEARYENGVLAIRVAKAASAQPRKIAVK